MGSGADTSVCESCHIELSCTRPEKYAPNGCIKYISEGDAADAIEKLKSDCGVKDNPPGKAEFSLDKLIDDHWGYVRATLLTHGVDDRDIEIARHHYKTAAKHFWKHACEHYGIEEKK